MRYLSKKRYGKSETIGLCNFKEIGSNRIDKAVSCEALQAEGGWNVWRETEQQKRSERGDREGGIQTDRHTDIQTYLHTYIYSHIYSNMGQGASPRVKGTPLQI